MPSIPRNIHNTRSQPPKRLVGCELIALAARDPAAFSGVCEENYRRRIATAVDKALAADCRIIMLTGPSAAGKTTSADRLAAELAARSRRSAVLGLDNFFVGAGRYPKQPDGSDDYECVEALDLPLLRACLRDLAEKGVCDAPRFDFLTQLPAPERQHIDCRGGVVIVEGLHAFNPALTQALPEGSCYHIYASLREEYAGPDSSRVLATRDIRLARRLTRDWLFRGHNADFTLGLWEHVCRSEEKYIKAFKNRADWVLDTAFSYEVCLWGHYTRNMQAETHAAALDALRARFAAFPPLAGAVVPPDSMLREFIGPKTETDPGFGQELTKRT